MGLKYSSIANNLSNDKNKLVYKN